MSHSYNDDLLIRAADVTLEERRRFVLVVRETPPHEGHLELMERVAEPGGVILPPIPAFYHVPRSIQDFIDHTIGRILDVVEIEHSLYGRWGGPPR